MAENEYIGKTKFDTFNVLGFGDRIWPDVEMENWQKVENSLLGGVRYNRLMSRGSFSVEAVDPSLSRITLSLQGLNPAFEGVIAGNYYKIDDNLVWEVDTSSDKTCWLYLSAIPGMTDPTSPDSLDMEVKEDAPYTDESVLASRLVMAAISIESGSVMITDDSPIEQEGNPVLKHELTSENPHGSVLKQDEIEVQKLTVGGAVLISEVLIEGVTLEVGYYEVNMRDILGLEPDAPVEVKFISFNMEGHVGAQTQMPYLAVIFDGHRAFINNTSYEANGRLLVKYVLG